VWRRRHTCMPLLPTMPQLRMDSFDTIQVWLRCFVKSGTFLRLFVNVYPPLELGCLLPHHLYAMLPLPARKPSSYYVTACLLQCCRPHSLLCIMSLPACCSTACLRDTGCTGQASKFLLWWGRCWMSHLPPAILRSACYATIT
jgi:hypothetical protein